MQGMEEVYIFIIGLSVVIGIFFIYTSTKKSKGKNDNLVIKSEVSKELNEKLKKISLTNYLLILINILLIIAIYQITETREYIPGDFGGYGYLQRIEDKINEIEKSLSNIDYTLYDKL